MATVSNTKVLSAVTSLPLSATAIAKKIGMSKGSQIQNILDDLVSDGSIIVDDSGRFPVYTKNKSKKTSVAKTNTAPKSAPVSSEAECSHISSDGSLSSLETDESIKKELTGYTIEKPATNKQGQTGVRVTIPSGKKIFINDGMTLVIINKTPKYLVDTPVRLVEACHNFARESGWSAYKITQLGVGQINGVDNVKMNDIVCMDITKVDKGA